MSFIKHYLLLNEEDYTPEEYALYSSHYVGQHLEDIAVEKTECKGDPRWLTELEGPRSQSAAPLTSTHVASKPIIENKTLNSKGATQMQIDMDISRKMRMLIQSSGIKHIDLANYLGLSESQFSSRYTMRCRWKLNEIKKLAPILDCDWRDIID